MFGYLTADLGRLNTEQTARYRSCYCGLCRAMRSEYGQMSRLALTYDMTFLILLLQSLYEQPEQAGCARCIAHPCKKRAHFTCEISRYAGAMNTLLAYYKCLDDWQDERKFLRLLYAKSLKKRVKKISSAYPRQCHAVKNSLAQLSLLEANPDTQADAAANAFAELMAELFVLYDDRWADTLREFGFALGKFVYFMDAVCDLKDDRRHKRQNFLLPLIANTQDGSFFEPHLKLLIGDAAEIFERLPLVQDAELLRNILYSGVWSRYDLQFHPKGKEA